ncbi:MAG TPA: lysylphosphatidylglycerol synthase domain-containing protein [Vicinamibacterales bacterium]|nr:lysylphosphatidylglycerol synthase domain-containing protein [Vicinamibacterales bacterium]
MNPATRSRLISLGAFAVGALLFIATLYYVDFHLVAHMGRRLALALLLSLFASGTWHLARTWAWSWCFPRGAKVSFLRLARVRLAAEAFSYLTLRGIAGEPLKVVLLEQEIDPRVATAAVALERIGYMVGTTLIVGLGSLIAIATLPLTHTWFRIFRGFAIAAGVLAVFTGIVLAGHGTYFLALVERIDRSLGTSMAGGRVGRFAGAVERQLLDLIRSHPLRLAVLTLATLIAYASMAAEAWIIMRAANVPISFAGALAVETFSRVASFASAFIPANLGALEASSIAAVTAVGAAAAGAPLALARRLRGLFWAGIGLAIYPRGRRPAVPAAEAPAPVQPHAPGSILLYIPTDDAVAVSALTRIAGLPIAERVLRSASRAGYSRVYVRADGSVASGVRRLAREVRSDVRIFGSDADWRNALSELPPDTVLTVAGAGTVVSPALFQDAAQIAADAGDVCDVPAGREWPASGLLRVKASDAGDVSMLARELRGRLLSGAALPTGEDVSFGRGRLALHVASDADLPAAERTIRRSSYKDTDNKVARANRSLSLPISIALIRTPLTANQLSVALVAIGFYCAWLFSTGHYLAGVLAGFLSLAASVLDGCDGEIARLKYQESALGCWIETFGDYSYYIAIFTGLTVGAARRTAWQGFYWLGAIALAGTLIAFALLIFLRNRITAGQPEKLHSIAKTRFKAEPTWWSRIIWRISFVATRSAMPYGIFALSLLGLLPLVVVLAAIGSNTYWISMVLKLRHLLRQDTEAVAA